MSKIEKWSGSANASGVQILNNGGGAIVSPTKVGYIIMTTDRVGLNRKFEAKQRNLNKPGVVLCSSMEQLKELAQLNPEIEAFYQSHWDKDILLGCILPWKKTSMKYIPDDGCKDLMMDKRQTSCFVIKFGVPSEQMVKELWDNGNKLIFASSANPSGKGNRGLITGIGERIESLVDLRIEANDYVASIQPDSVATRHEQGVMVAMVDANGTLVAMQEGKREITPCPTIIRKGLDNEKIMALLAEHFTSWDFRQGTYY